RMQLPTRLMAIVVVAWAFAGCTLGPIPLVVTTAPASPATLVWHERDWSRQEWEERHTCSLPCTVEIHTERDYAIEVDADGYLPASATLYYQLADGTRLRQGGLSRREAHLVIPLFARSRR